MVLEVRRGVGVFRTREREINRSHAQEWAGGERNRLFIDSIYLEST